MSVNSFPELVSACRKFLAHSREHKLEHTCVPNGMLEALLDQAFTSRPLALTDEHKTKALELFKAYFRENYPGPKTIISDPDWHSPKLFNAVVSCLRETGRVRPAL